MLDEPVNGLDPEGIRWIRNLLKELAAEGRTVFVSSHLMSEMALTAEHFIIIGRGRLIADVSAAELAAMGPEPQVLVRTPHGDRLRQVLAADGVQVTGEATAPTSSTSRASRPTSSDGACWREASSCTSSHRDRNRSRDLHGLTQDAVQYQSHDAHPSTPERRAA